MRIWHEGTWLLDVAPQIVHLSPKEGQPLISCRIATQLNPGLYLITAYGGPSIPWSEESKIHPFYLRFGIPKLASAGRKRFVMSPFGIDRYLVPGTTNYYRLELPEAQTANLLITNYSKNNPFSASGNWSQITKKSIPPVTEVNASSHNGFDLVQIKANQGQSYVLQQFIRQNSTYLPPGNFWISSVHSGHAIDSVDTTAFIVENTSERGHIRPLDARVIDLEQKPYWHCNINLLGDLTIFLRASSSTHRKYRIVAKGVEANFKIEPYMLYPPHGYQTPNFKTNESIWDLDPGYYVLTVSPIQKGIIELGLPPASAFKNAAEFFKSKEKRKSAWVNATVTFPQVSLSPNHSYYIYLNQKPEQAAGIIIRPLPVDLTDALPLAQKPNEQMQVPIVIKEKGVLSATTENGSLLETSIDGKTWDKQQQLSPGQYTVSIRHQLAETTIYSLEFIPLQNLSKSPLPPLPDSSLKAIPKYPLLTTSKPIFFDLKRYE
ncbi:MAG: hypothetical protein JW841_11560 [Deltaproteobacteria bacterium]|nr:hypothetical protein [Deltaproteobacteria bacterium]